MTHRNSELQQIDNNHAVNTSILRDEIKFHDVEEAPFRLYDVFKEKGKWIVPQNAPYGFGRQLWGRYVCRI